MLSVRPQFALVLTLGSLVACSDSTPNNPTPLPTEPKLTALVVGDADSPFLDALEERASTVQDDGSQTMTDHDLVIFDGDTHVPTNLTENPRLAEALAAGTWVLVADAKCCSQLHPLRTSQRVANGVIRLFYC